MADEITPAPADGADHPDDFAAVALKLTKTDPDQKVETKVEKVEEVKKESSEVKSKIPDSLFETKEVKEEKKEEKKDEAFDIDKIADQEFKDARSKAKWDELKTKGREFEKQARENGTKATALEAKIKEYEEKGKDTEALQAKLAKLEEEHRSAMELVRKVNMELDPEYRKTFVEGRKNLIGHAKTIAEESGINPSDVEAALNLTGKARVDALKAVAEDMDSFQQGRLGRVIDQLTQLDNDAQAKRSNPEEYLEQRQKEEESRAEKEAQEHMKTANLAFESALSKARNELEVLRRVDGMPEWNSTGEDIRVKSKEFWNGNRDPQKAAELVIQGFAAPVFRQLFLDQRSENKALRKEFEAVKAELKSLYAGSPRLQGATVRKDGQPRDFADHASGLMSGSITN